MQVEGYSSEFGKNYVCSTTTVSGLCREKYGGPDEEAETEF
jgi:hypothetical protein